MIHVIERDIIVFIDKPIQEAIPDVLPIKSSTSA